MLRRARPKRDDLEQSAGHHHILEKVDHLVLIGKVPVRNDSAVASENTNEKLQRRCGL